jgi:hypothetical protein
MKTHTVSVLLVMSALVVSAQARPSTSTEMRHPSTSVTVVRPFTAVETTHAVTSVGVVKPATQVQVIHPQTQVGVNHPTTQVELLHPQTQVNVIHPQTTVEVIHPRTTVEMLRPQTLEVTDEGATENGSSWKGGSGGFSSKTSTSMSNFKPMQAKDLSAKPPTMEKAAPLGGGDVKLGNDTNVTEKDNANKSSLLGAQQSAQDMDVDPKQNTKLDGLEKLLTDRAKFKEKQQQ